MMKGKKEYVNIKKKSKYYYIMRFTVQELGNELGRMAGGYIGNKFKYKQQGKKIGALVGKFAGRHLPFQNGEFIKPPKEKILKL